MAPLDPKVKKAEAHPHLGFDSPMVIWLTDLESLGLRDVVFKTGGGAGTSGGGTGAPDPAVSVEPPPPPPEPVVEPEPEPEPEYVAVCEEAPHPPETPGALADGRWVGSLFRDFESAQAEASAHEHGSAFVALYVQGAFIGPVKPF